MNSLRTIKEKFILPELKPVKQNYAKKKSAQNKKREKGYTSNE